VRAEFVGHPLADTIPTTVDAGTARRALGLGTASQVLALLPGSRRSEVARLARPFLATAAWLKARRPLEVVVALANESVGAEFRAATAGIVLDPPATLVTGRAQEVMAAADAVLTASGTASLEALLLKRPMVVAYRMTAVSYWILRRMGVARLKHFSLPNLLAGRELVAEYAQGQVRPEVLGPAVLACLEGRMRDPNWRAQFDAIHEQLRRGASQRAAAAVLSLVEGAAA
jgi:lipid-A-disaccharide synthase